MAKTYDRVEDLPPDDLEAAFEYFRTRFERGAWNGDQEGEALMMTMSEPRELAERIRVYLAQAKKKRRR
jgi:uncharacterized membrane protein